MKAVKKEYTGVMTFAQQAEGAVSPVSLELIGKARELGGPVTAVLPGSNMGHLAGELIAHGADRVVVIDGDIRTAGSPARQAADAEVAGLIALCRAWDASGTAS